MMNEIQKTYIAAKAYADTLKANLEEAEHQWIVDHGIKNPDGSTPKLIYCIEDEELFDKCNQEHGGMVDASPEWAEMLQAEELLKQAEAVLIEWALSIVPAKQRQTLTEAAAKNIVTRWKIRDLALQLDVSTLKKKGA